MNGFLSPIENEHALAVSFLVLFAMVLIVAGAADAGLDGSGCREEDEEVFKERTLELIKKHFPHLLSDE